MTTGIAPDNNSLAKFYPLEVGNEWTYLIGGDVHDSGETVTFTVVDASGELGSREFVIAQSSEDDLKPLILVESSRGLSEEGTDIYLLKFPLEKSQRWTGTLDDSFDSKNKSLTFEVIDTNQTIQLGEHTFTGCLVIRKTDEARQRTEQVTYAPGVGPVLYAGGMGASTVKDTLTIMCWDLQETA